MTNRGQRIRWATGFLGTLMLVLGTLHLGCSPPPTEDDDLGGIRLAIKAAPSDVRCIQITAQGTRTVVTRFT